MASIQPSILVFSSILLYTVSVPFLRPVVGDMVSALSTIPVLIAGTVYRRMRTWMTAILMILITGLLFRVTDGRVQTNAEIRGAILGSLVLLVVAELMGRVSDGARRLEKTGESKDRFLAGVGHELRTPLTAVVGYASILKATWPRLEADERAELVDILHQQTGEVASIVEDLLAASRLDTSDLTFSVGRVALVREVENSTSALAVPPNTKFEISIPEEIDVMVDPGRLRQIMRNLVSNAFRYGGSKVTVGAERYGHQIVVSVCDNGNGIPTEEWESVFDAYYRSHNRAGQPDSVGLGLTVARRLARRMDGDLIYRMHGGESQFLLTLPTPEASEDYGLAVSGYRASA